MERVTVSRDIPSECARKLVEQEVDVGLIPVAALPSVPNAQVLTNQCIGCDGPVHSVCLYSDVPIEQADRVLLDYHSRTSVQLARMLAERHWNVAPAFVDAQPGFENEIGGTTAGVVIGDRTFELNNRFAYVYDLGAEWQALTGLPFVFAVWVANKQLPEWFTTRFAAAMDKGVQHIDAALADAQLANNARARDYLHHSISYALDASKRKAMTLYLDWATALQPLAV